MESHKSALEEWTDTENPSYLFHLYFTAVAVQVGQSEHIKVESGRHFGPLLNLLMATSPSLLAPAKGSDLT